MAINARALANRIQETYQKLPEWKKNTIQFDAPAKNQDKEWTVGEILDLIPSARQKLYHVKAQYMGRPQRCLVCLVDHWTAWEGGYGVPARICDDCMNRPAPTRGQLDLFDDCTEV